MSASSITISLQPPSIAIWPSHGSNLKRAREEAEAAEAMEAEAPKKKKAKAKRKTKKKGPLRLE
ncbi:MAG: hypothetical protein R3C05_23470 [Pirellulaceae bacterium]